ncbi:MAG: hypothetical protein PUH82_08500 [Bacteroidales bacterium]|nr:hypothetical protein [Bacteroidales bacterium]
MARRYIHIVFHGMIFLAARRSRTPTLIPIKDPMISFPVKRLAKHGMMIDNVHQPSIENVRFMTPEKARIPITPAAISARPNIVFNVRFILLAI